MIWIVVMVSVWIVMPTISIMVTIRVVMVIIVRIIVSLAFVEPSIMPLMMVFIWIPTPRTVGVFVIIIVMLMVLPVRVIVECAIWIIEAISVVLATTTVLITTTSVHCQVLLSKLNALFLAEEPSRLLHLEENFIVKGRALRVAILEMNGSGSQAFHLSLALFVFEGTHLDLILVTFCVQTLEALRVFIGLAASECVIGLNVLANPSDLFLFRECLLTLFIMI